MVEEAIRQQEAASRAAAWGHAASRTGTVCGAAADAIRPTLDRAGRRLRVAMTDRAIATHVPGLPMLA